MSKILSYNQVLLRLQHGSAVLVVPWKSVLMVSYGPEAQHNWITLTGESSYRISEQDARVLSDLLDKVLKSHPIEDVDFDSED